jgi:hypothetical protein
MSLAERITAAIQQATADGRSPHHVTLCLEDWPADYPTVTFKPGPDATYSVLWAMDRKGFKLTPYKLGGS